MYGLQFPVGTATGAAVASKQTTLSRQAAERYALVTAARRRGGPAIQGRRSRAIGQRRTLSGILFRLSSRATTFE